MQLKGDMWSPVMFLGQAKIDELFHLRLVGEIAELLIKVETSYTEFVTHESGKTVIYAKLSKALHGTLQVAILFW